MSQPLHIALDPSLYKKSKAGILTSEIAILNSMKHLYLIRQTQLQQKEIRKKIFEAFNYIKERMEKLDEKKLPTIHDIPKQNFKKEKINLGSKMPIAKKQKVTDDTSHSLEEELEEIQKKLDKLNLM